MEDEAGAGGGAWAWDLHLRADCVACLSGVPDAFLSVSDEGAPGGGIEGASVTT